MSTRIPDVPVYGRPPTGDPHHDAMCATKKGFPSKSQAKKAAKQFARWQNSARGMEPYLCQYCGLWHNGHSRTEPRRR
jgi:hypothetical protein